MPTVCREKKVGDAEKCLTGAGASLSILTEYMVSFHFKVKL